MLSELTKIDQFCLRIRTKLKMTKLNDQFGHGIRTKLKMTKINNQFGHGIKFKLKMITYITIGHLFGHFKLCHSDNGKLQF